MGKRGFTKTPNAALFDDRLSLQEKAVYSMLLHQVWLHRPERVEGDVLGQPVPLPATPELAEAMGISDKTFRRYLNKLRSIGYVRTDRPRRRAPLVYTVYVSPSPVVPDPTESGRAGVDHAGAVLSPGEDVTSEDGPFGSTLARRDDPTEVPWEVVGDPPKLCQDEMGKNLAVDALAEICGIAKRSPRFGEIATALHGRRRNLAREPGINRLFWFEMATHYGLTLPEIRARAAANPTGYHEALVRGIQHRATIYRERLNGATITPTALAKWWLDLELTQSPDGLSPEEIRNLD